MEKQEETPKTLSQHEAAKYILDGQRTRLLVDPSYRSACLVPLEHPSIALLSCQYGIKYILRQYKYTKIPILTPTTFLSPECLRLHMNDKIPALERAYALNHKAARLAREVAGPQNHVGGIVDLSFLEFELRNGYLRLHDAQMVVYDQTYALINGGADYILFQGCSNPDLLFEIIPVELLEDTPIAFTLPSDSPLQVLSLVNRLRRILKICGAGVCLDLRDNLNRDRLQFLSTIMNQLDIPTIVFFNTESADKLREQGMNLYQLQQIIQFVISCDVSIVGLGKGAEALHHYLGRLTLTRPLLPQDNGEHQEDQDVFKLIAKLNSTYSSQGHHVLTPPTCTLQLSTVPIDVAS